MGFPDSYREGKEGLILDDIASKLTRLSLREQVVVDVGAGCGGLAPLIMERCAEQGHRLFQVDSPEMLALLPEAPHVERVPAASPRSAPDCSNELGGRAHCVLAYGVLPCVFVESNVFEFVDRALELLAEGGQLLLADLPNLSKRKRFFASEAGVRFHQEFMGRPIARTSRSTCWSRERSTTRSSSRSCRGAVRPASTLTSSRNARACRSRTGGKTSSSSGPDGPLRVERYTADRGEEWNEFVRRSKNGTFLFERGYMEYHGDRFVDCSLIVRDDRGRLIALLPASRHDDALVSHGGLTYGGFVSEPG